MMQSKSYQLPIALFAFTLIALMLASCERRDRQTREMDHDTEAWLGVYVDDLDREMRNYLDIDEAYGAIVNEVVEDSPADRAGLRREDVIVRYNGRRIRHTRDLTRAVRNSKPRDEIELEIVRNRERQNVRVALASRRSESFAGLRVPSPPAVPIPPTPPSGMHFRLSGGPWLGVELTDMNSDLAEYFDAQDEGVLILSVDEGSPAAEAGLKAGDIIIAIENRNVRRSGDVSDVLRDFDSRDEVEIQIKRKGESQTVTAKLQSAPHSSFYRFDRQDWRDRSPEWRNEWRDEMRRWKNEMRDWKREFKRGARQDLDRRIRQEIEREIRIEIDKNLKDSMIDLEMQIDPQLDNLDLQLDQLDLGLKQLERELSRLGESL